ncbi:MAG: M48 family metallopeptidase [Ruminococcaceae bacterium]|nr:M48 family metallopeptidase [Oscillospiraceae bacterium]
MQSDRIYYELLRSDRKTCQIQVKADGSVIVRAPKRMPLRDIERFVSEKSDWIENAFEKNRRAREQIKYTEPLTHEEIGKLANMALEYIPKRVEHYAPIVGAEYGNITIRNQKTRWGSCSGKKNLNFNCLLMLTDERIIDYVVVHELCHLKEMNHSERFWAEVEKVLPEYKASRAWLKANGTAIIARMTK